MEKCLYEKNCIYADQIKLNFTLEQQIRLAGSERKLSCYECGKPVIYKRGEIKDAHFAHLELTEECEYEEYTKYCKGKSQSWRIVKQMLLYHFSNTYPDARIERDERLFKGHYTDFYMELSNGTKIAIELDDKTMTSKKLQDLNAKYQELNLTVDWIVLDTVKKFDYDHNVYHIKRSRLNESINHSVIVVDRHDFTFCLYKLDTNKYIYTDTNQEFHFKENVFSEPIDFEQLRINEKGLYVEGFEAKYQKWLKTRIDMFNQHNHQITKNNCNEDYYLDLLNRILGGELELIESVASRLSHNRNQREYQLFKALYLQFKELNLVEYVKIFEDVFEQMIMTNK